MPAVALLETGTRIFALTGNIQLNRHRPASRR
jgi:hypothetical protein